MFVATREIRRSLGRFALLTGAVALLVVLLLFFQAVSGTLTSGLTGGFESTSADVLVFDERARGNPFASVLAPSLVDDVSGLADVVAAAPIALGVFSGSGPDGDLDVVIVGGDPSGPSVPGKVTDGRLPETPGEVLFGGSSFEAALAIGDEVSIGELTLVVVGVTDDAAFNVSPTLYTLFEDYVSLSRERAGAPIDVPISLVGVAVAADEDPAAVAESITASIDGVVALERGAAVDALP
ncbi:MAG: ABC transporter permease, partial [Acidimicrobiia bacterium]|nr:ABC transporter permease [Acidimicrobiia bacterium]